MGHSHWSTTIAMIERDWETNSERDQETNKEKETKLIWERERERGTELIWESSSKGVGGGSDFDLGSPNLTAVVIET